MEKYNLSENEIKKIMKVNLKEIHISYGVKEFKKTYKIEKEK